MAQLILASQSPRRKELLEAAGIEFTVGALMQQAFGGYAAALTREFNWSRSTIGIGFSLSRLENGILGPLQGWMIDRLGPQWVIRIGLCLLAAGFMAFSRLDSITSFYLSFGLMALGAGLAGTAAARSIAAGNGQLVLVADDEDSIREIVCSVLASAGYAVESAADGLAAAALYAERPSAFALLVSD